MSEDTLPGTETAGDPDGGARAIRPGIVLALVLSCQTMFILDTSVVNIALPQIQKSLDFSPENLSWVLNAYLLAFGGLLLLGGRLSDLLGQRRVLVGGVVIFTAASLLGGLAPSAGWLVAARAAQGVGAALAAPTVLAVISTHFAEGAPRTRALGAYAAVSGSGAALGLIAGGMLTDWVSWRWVLFINVPIGIAIVLLAPVFIRESPARPARLDISGSLTSTVGVTALVYGFIRAASDGWSDAQALGSFAVSVVLLAGFVVIEARTAQPITPLRLFANRNRASGYLALLFVMAAGNSLFFFLTQFLQEVLGYGPLKAGLSFLPLAALILVAAGAGEKILPRFGPKAVIAVGTAGVTIALLWLSRMSPSSGYLANILGPMVIAGVGMGLILVAITTVLLGGVEAEDAGAASGLLNVMQQIGGALGLAILVAVFGNYSRDAADDAAAATEPHHVLTEGITGTFAIGAVFTALTIVLTLFMRSIPAAAQSAAPSEGPSEGPVGGAVDKPAKDNTAAL